MTDLMLDVLYLARPLGFNPIYFHVYTTTLHVRGHDAMLLRNVIANSEIPRSSLPTMPMPPIPRLLYLV